MAMVDFGLGPGGPIPAMSSSDASTPAHAAPCLIVGEVALAHDGSLGFAHAFVDAIARAGADAVKFQTHIAAAESTDAEPWRVKFSRQDVRRYDYWQRTAFTPEQWQGLRQHAADKGLRFISSPFSVEAVDLLVRLDVDALKIASGEVGNTEVLQACAASGKPVQISSGMSPWAELDEAVRLLRAAGSDLAVLQCTTAYPCPPERIGLNLLAEIRERYGCAVGLSDHSGTIYPGLAAATLGADVLEVHVTLSREMFGPDVPASLTTTELADLVRGVRFIEAMRAHPVEKDAAAGVAAPMRALFTRSIVAREALPAGTRLTREMLALKKPGTGLPPSELPRLLGATLVRAIAPDEPIREADVRQEINVQS
jgi:N,N'-diacetyllegionaminate synthase